MKFYQRQRLNRVTAVLLLSLLLISNCRPSPQVDEKRAAPPAQQPLNQPLETAPASLNGEMIEPTTPFSVMQVTTDTIQVAPVPRTNKCPRLESTLLNLSTAENPAAFAQSNRLFYDGAATRVIIELPTADAGISFLNEYNAQIESETESLVQALVPLTDLCALANDSQIKFIRVPRGAVTP
jgi:hypothetical protein